MMAVRVEVEATPVPPGSTKLVKELAETSFRGWH